MNNIEKIRQATPEYYCGAMLVTSPIARLYATGFKSTAGALLVTDDNAWFFTDSRYFEAAKTSITGANVCQVTKDETYFDLISAQLKARGISSIGFEEGTVTYSGYLEWEEKLGTKMVSAQKLLDNLRAVKSRSDLEQMILAQRIAEKTFEELLPLISTDITEKELATEFIYRAMRNGADDKAFDPIVVSAPRSSLPHGVPTNEKISKGFLTIDFGVQINGWCSDTTRTLCIGQPDEEMIKIYDTVLEAQETGIRTMRGGVKGFDVDAAARSVIENAGYGEFFGHGFGHTLGLEVHEALKASQVS